MDGLHPHVLSAIKLNTNEEVASFYYSCSLCKVPDLFVGEDECHCLCVQVCVSVCVCANGAMN